MTHRPLVICIQNKTLEYTISGGYGVPMFATFIFERNRTATSIKLHVPLGTKKCTGFEIVKVQLGKNEETNLALAVSLASEEDSWEEASN